MKTTVRYTYHPVRPGAPTQQWFCTYPMRVIAWIAILFNTGCGLTGCIRAEIIETEH